LPLDKGPLRKYTTIFRQTRTRPASPCIPKSNP
jgi:uncharacterized protein YbaR (Trm112 family)